MTKTLTNRSYNSIKYSGYTLSYLLICLFFVIPFFSVFFFIKIEDFKFIFSDSIFYEAVGNSLLYCSISSVITVCLAFLIAYIINCSQIKFKNVFKNVLILSMLIPSISIGLGFKTFFSVNGILNTILPFINIDCEGFFGLIFGSVNMTFLLAFLLFFDCLKYEYKTTYDACETLNVSKFAAFKNITFPYITKTLIITFFISFVYSITDYGISFEIRGKIPTLAFYLYEQVLSNFEYGRGIIICFILVIPTIISFIVEYKLKENKNSQAQDTLIKWDKKYNKIIYGILSIFIFVLLIPQISFITTSFIKSFPADYTFTFNNYILAFNSKSTISISRALLNSLIIAFICSLLTTVFSFVLAYFTSRTNLKGKNILNLLILASQAFPGLMLGISYVCFFKNTNGFFYGSFLILIVVNVIHFYASPYIMCKNALSKLDMNYEINGETLSISKFKIIWSVILPNCYKTLLEMFSYVFINCMVTISAVSFLCTFFNQPLSMLILTYGRNDSYEMQSVIATTILFINVVFKSIVYVIEKYLDKHNNNITRKVVNYSKFCILTTLIKNRKMSYDSLCLCCNELTKEDTKNNLEELLKLNYINETNNQYIITQKGIDSISAYKVKNAIILAAGFGRRMIPLTFDTPKPLLKVNGEPIIESQIKSLIKNGITDITIVLGYRYRDFLYLKNKYSGISFILNKNFINTNNIYSLSLVPKNKLNRTYIIEGDLFITNPTIFKQYRFNSCILCEEKTDDSLNLYSVKTNSNLLVTKFYSKIIFDYVCVGINYFNFTNSLRLGKDLEKVKTTKKIQNMFYDDYIFSNNLKNYKKTYIDNIPINSVLRIDTIQDLVKYDKTYEPILEEIYNDFRE